MSLSYEDQKLYIANLEEQRDDLKEQVDRWKVIQATEAREHGDTIRELRAALREYGEHTICPVQDGYPEEGCTCGWSKWEKALGEEEAR